MRNRVIAAVGLAGLVLGAGATPAFAASKAPSKPTVSGKNGSLHQVKVRAKSSKGYSKYSTTVSVRIGLPGAPTAVIATKGNAKVAASWKAAASNGATITGYRVYTRYLSGSKYSG